MKAQLGQYMQKARHWRLKLNVRACKSGEVHSITNMFIFDEPIKDLANFAFTSILINRNKRILSCLP